MEYMKLDLLLISLANQNNLKGETRQKFKRIGRDFFDSKVKEYVVKNPKNKSEEYARIDTLIYFKELFKQHLRNGIEKYIQDFNENSN